MASALDTMLIQSFTAGMNVPLPTQAGYEARASADGTNIEYVGPQVSAGSVVWDGKAAQILVGGSGARAVTLKNGYHLGQRVTIADAAGNAGSGTITVGVSEGALSGTATITSNFGTREYLYVAAGQWALV